MKCLILDDMEERHESLIVKLTAAGHTVHSALTFHAAQKLVLEEGEGYDTMFLDHDLGDAYKDASSYVDDYGRRCTYTGADFCWWLVNQQIPMPKNVYVHSVNPSGAANMVMTLAGRGIVALAVPFPSLLKQL